MNLFDNLCFTKYSEIFDLLVKYDGLQCGGRNQLQATTICRYVLHGWKWIAFYLMANINHAKSHSVWSVYVPKNEQIFDLSLTIFKNFMECHWLWLWVSTFLNKRLKWDDVVVHFKSLFFHLNAFWQIHVSFCMALKSVPVFYCSRGTDFRFTRYILTCHLKRWEWYMQELEIRIILGDREVDFFCATLRTSACISPVVFGREKCLAPIDLKLSLHVWVTCSWTVRQYQIADSSPISAT